MTALLWLYAGSIGSSNPLWLKADLVCANPSCSSWVFLLVPAHPDSPGQRAVTWLCASVSITISLQGMTAAHVYHALL